MGLSAQARELALRCEPRINALARDMARDAFADLPGYAAIPGDMKDLEIAATARHGLRLFMSGVRDPRGRHGDIGLFRERAAQRAEEGLPLQLLLRTHARGTHVLWRALREETRPGEEAALAELTDLLLTAQEHTVGAVAETYLDERAALDAERTEHRRSLVRALLDETTPPERRAARAAELGLDGPCLVLALELPAPEREAAARHLGAVTERRVLRRLQTALDHAFGTEAPALLEGAAQGRALVPGTPEPPDGLMGRLDRAAGPGVRVAAVRAAGTAEIPEAARTAGEVLRVARACGRPPGLHRLDDVLLEFQLSRRTAGSGPIAALLDPVADRPELLATLRVHLEQRQERRGTARLLGVHPNTVDNRLARVCGLTGLDLASPRGTALAIAALLLRDGGPDSGRDGGQDGGQDGDGERPTAARTRGASGGPPGSPGAAPREPCPAPRRAS